MKILITVLALAMGVSAVSDSVESFQESSPDIRVLISHSGSTRIKAAITNHGEKGYNILSTGTFLDNRPVEKATVSNDGVKVPFVGIKLFYKKTGIDPTAFISLGASQTYEIEFDLAETHPLHKSPHGLHNIKSEGQLHYADFNSTQLLGQVPFSSNQIFVDVDLTEAAAKFESHSKRSELAERAAIARCSSTQGAQVSWALGACSRQARAAANAARAGGRLYDRWFGDRSRAAAIVNRLNWVAGECVNNGNNRITIQCNESGSAENLCNSGGTIAFVRTEQNRMILCGLFFQDPETTTNCGNIGISRAATLIHEFMHLEPAGCSDFANTPAGALALSPANKFRNCENYSLFAGELAANC